MGFSNLGLIVGVLKLRVKGWGFKLRARVVAFKLRVTIWVFKLRIKGCGFQTLKTTFTAFNN